MQRDNQSKGTTNNRFISMSCIDKSTFYTELIEISDDSCELKATRQVLKQVNRAKIEFKTEASTSCTKSPCRMSNTSIGDQD